LDPCHIIAVTLEFKVPRFSIVITCFNQAGFIKDAVDSALAQENPDREVIVVDDASTDDSRTLLASYGDRILCSNLPRNMSAPTARNVGASISKGDILVFLDGDDILMPWALNIYGRVLDQKDAQVIIGNMQWFVGTAPREKAEKGCDRIAVVCYESSLDKDRRQRLSASSFVIRRRAFEQIGGWTPDIFPCDDFDFLVKVAGAGRLAIILKPETVYYRVHSNNTIKRIDPYFPNMRRVLEKERQGHYPGGKSGRLGRYVLIGGPVFFTVKKAFRERRYLPGLRLLASAWAIVLWAAIRRLATIITGARKAEFLPIP
jgi:glycosyltransferase involved in cell wall biosynthesis